MTDKDSTLTGAVVLRLMGDHSNARTVKIQRFITAMRVIDGIDERFDAYFVLGAVYRRWKDNED